MPRKKVNEGDVVVLPKKASTQRRKQSILEEGAVPASRLRKGSGFVLMFLVVGVLVIIGAIFLGRMDTGVIDVNQAIELSNQSQRESGGTGMVQTVPTEFQNQVNGGLVPTDNQSTQETVSGESASSTIATDATATSTATTTQSEAAHENGEASPDSDSATTTPEV
ncbi:MAG TPA: hypothetical protein VFV22_00590 [Candidatus Paceibacterota bacterium]|nr:hypothetical protein [Candidatus Paceibacterota bacterium]